MAANKKYREDVAEVEKQLKASWEKYNVALKAFQDAHPEGYHITLKDGDNVTTLQYKTQTNYSDMLQDYLKDFNDTIAFFKDFWK